MVAFWGCESRRRAKRVARRRFSHGVVERQWAGEFYDPRAGPLRPSDPHLSCFGRPGDAYFSLNAPSIPYLRPFPRRSIFLSSIFLSGIPHFVVVAKSLVPLRRSPFGFPCVAYDDTRIHDRRWLMGGMGGWRGATSCSEVARKATEPVLSLRRRRRGPAVAGAASVIQRWIVAFPRPCHAT